MHRLTCFAIAASLAGLPFNAAPASGGEKDEPTRWYVYQDAGSQANSGIWSNFMPEEAGKMVKLSLSDATSPFDGKSCIKVEIKWLNPNWAGVAVSSKENYWGEQAGQAFDLRKAKKLVFHARGARGGESIQVKAAILGDKPFGDSARIPVSTEWISLTTKWKRYELDVSDTDLSRVVTPFCFVSNTEHNRSDITFYLDAIYYEMGDR